MRSSLIAVATVTASLLVAGDAAAESVGVVVIGRATPPASRAALRLSSALEDRGELEVVRSEALRRALAGIPVAQEAEDPLADVRELAGAARGERRRQSLERLGNRLELERLVTVARVGDELELRVFDVPRSAFYRGTLMVPADRRGDSAEVLDFLSPRLREARGVDGEESEEQGERPSRWRNWWIWAIVGGAVVAVAAVAYFVDPGGGNEDVRLRIVAP